MPKIETHFHTKESSPCGYIPAKEAIEIFANNGYDAVVVTDHFSRSVCGLPDERHWDDVCQHFLSGWRAALKTAERLAIKVYLGMELRFPNDENDFLVYGVTKDFLFHHPWLYEESLEVFAPIAQQEGLAIVQAHPFRPECQRVNPNLINGVEIANFNPRHDSHNSQAWDWAKEHDLLWTAGSDYHRGEDFSGAGIWMAALPNSEIELAKAIVNAQYQLMLPGR